MKKVLKIALWIIGILAFMCIASILICYHVVSNNAKGKAFAELSSIQPHKVGLLLGTTPQSRYNRNTNYFFIYRIDAAEDLFKAGKIEQILISGDENSLDGINEPECMRDSLVARGIPADAIVLDGKVSECNAIIIHEVRIGDIVINDVEGSITNSSNAPLLIGQSVLKQLGNITVDYERGVIVIK